MRYFILILFLFLSCSKEAEPTPEELIVGTWRALKFSNNCLDGTVIEEDSSACLKRSVWEFGENGTVRVMSFGLDRDNECEFYDDSEGAWEVEKDTLYFLPEKNGDWVTKLTYFKVSENSLKLGRYWTSDEDPDIIRPCEEGYSYLEFEKEE